MEGVTTVACGAAGGAETADEVLTAICASGREVVCCEKGRTTSIAAIATEAANAAPPIQRRRSAAFACAKPLADEDTDDATLATA